MTNSEAIKILKSKMDGSVDTSYEWCECIRMAIKALEQEPCEDVISKKDTIEWLKKVTVTDGITFKTGFKQILHDIEQMPPVTPRPKMGYWKVVSDGYGDNAYICECSECKDTVWVYKDADKKWNYCPNCGAKMQEVKE